MRPQLFLVGAPKAGTSALSTFLAQHPQIAMCRIKEPNYHCPDLDLPGPATEAEYLALFEPGPQTRILCDASILYLYSREAAERIRCYAPDAAILMLLRNPLEAMLSWHSQMVFTANENFRDFGQALRAEPERKAGRRRPRTGVAARCPELLFYRDVMRYAEQIERYLAVFDRDQIRILFYEDFVAAPLEVYAGILGFLRLDPFEPRLRRVNVNKERRSWKLHSALKVAFAAPARALLSPRLRLDLIGWLDRLNSRELRRNPIDAELERQLREELRPEIERLGELTGHDLSHWSS